MDEPIAIYEALNTIDYFVELDTIIGHLEKIDIVIENQQLLIELFQNIYVFLELIGTLLVAFFVWTIIKALYKYLSMIFGGIF
ncbi:hypothetical protein [Tissierella sp.]|uniref:hypothetical protein n=1 Tax=Tissierella sp. TaxID=41274 RepID=UPI00305915B1